MLSKCHHDADADMVGIYKGLNYMVKPCVLVGTPADISAGAAQRGDLVTLRLQAGAVVFWTDLF